MTIFFIIAAAIIIIIVLNTKKTNKGRVNLNQQINDIVEELGKNNSINYWEGFKSRKPKEAKDIEALTGKDLALVSDVDAFQIVTTVLRWSKNSNTPISKLKNQVLNELDGRKLSSSEIDVVISLIEKEKYKEAKTFNIKPENTVSAIMIKCLKDTCKSNPYEPIDINGQKVAPDISQLNNTENKLIRLAEKGVEFLKSNFSEPLSPEGEKEVLLYCSSRLVDLPTNYTNNIDMDVMEDRYFLLLHDKMCHPSVDDTIDFINKRIAFYKNEYNKLRENQNYTSMLIYGTFYKKPLCSDPTKYTPTGFDTMQLMVFDIAIRTLDVYLYKGLEDISQ